MAAVSDLMLRRPCINVLTGQQDMASWHQREIVPVRQLLVVCCGVLALRTAHPAVQGRSRHRCRCLRSRFSLPTARLLASPSTTGRVSQKFPGDLRASCQPPPYHASPARENMSSPAPAGCLIDMLLLVSLLLLRLGCLPVSHRAYAMNLAAG